MIFSFDLDSTDLENLALSETLEPALGRVTYGLTTKDDPRFVRLRWEVPEDSLGPGKLWVPFSKGGEYSWFTSDTHLVVKQGTGAEEIAAFALTRDGNVASTRARLITISVLASPSLAEARKDLAQGGSGLARASPTRAPLSLSRILSTAIG